MIITGGGVAATLGVARNCLRTCAERCYDAFERIFAPPDYVPDSRAEAGSG